VQHGNDGATILDDYEAIRNLKSWYAECADAKYTDGHQKKPKDELDAVAWQQAMCFTEDAEWDAGIFGVLRGRQALFENFRTKPWLFTMHLYTNPRLEVQGDRATGKWALWMVATEEGSGRPMHLCGYTDDEYRKVDGKWYFSKVALTQKFLVPFDQPWSPPAG
jgi:hypothetical protein